MKKILGAAIGECVHVAGVYNFLSLAEQEGIETVFLGPAVCLDRLVAAIRTEQPDVVALGYRLADVTCASLLEELKGQLAREGLLDREYVFGGTTHTAEPARNSGLFRQVFDGTQTAQELRSYLGGIAPGTGREEAVYPDTLAARIEGKHPLPLTRQHIGRPTVERTIEEIRIVAQSRQLDVISLATDQVAQESFFRPEEQVRRATGAGGVPVRSEEDLLRIYAAGRRGNHPLMRCYSGTADLLKWAEMLLRTVHNAWAAIPIFWYNELDGRSRRPLATAIREAQDVIRWHGARGIPVECNDPHQWSLRYATDATAIAVGYLAAHNAKRLGVRQYVSQYMLQTPPQVSPLGDLAKMLATIELIEGLEDDCFRAYREVRPGLLGFPPDLDSAKGHLGFATAVSLALKPHIFHVVSYCEAQYAAGAPEIIESAKLVNHMFKSFRRGFPLEAIASDPGVVRRKEKLQHEALVIVEAIRSLGPQYADPLIEPTVLAKAVEAGILDAPNLKNRKPARGDIATAPVDGNYVPVDPATGKRMTERQRLQKTLESVP